MTIEVHVLGGSSQIMKKHRDVEKRTEVDFQWAFRKGRGLTLPPARPCTHHFSRLSCLLLAMREIGLDSLPSHDK